MEITYRFNRSVIIGGIILSDELSEEILKELKKINEKLGILNEPKGLSTPNKIIAFTL
jgi:hypothetical protein